MKAGDPCADKMNGVAIAMQLLSAWSLGLATSSQFLLGPQLFNAALRFIQLGQLTAEHAWTRKLARIRAQGLACSAWYGELGVVHLHQILRRVCSGGGRNQSKLNICQLETVKQSKDGGEAQEFAGYT